MVRQGEEVVLSGGVYYAGEFTISRSGTEAAPIVIRGKQGETAVLDGSDPSQFTWAHQGGGVYRTTLNVEEPHVVMANGKRLFPYSKLTDQTLFLAHRGSGFLYIGEFNIFTD
jgi:hypothetical protein